MTLSRAHLLFKVQAAILTSQLHLKSVQFRNSFVCFEAESENFVETIHFPSALVEMFDRNLRRKKSKRKLGLRQRKSVWVNGGQAQVSRQKNDMALPIDMIAVYLGTLHQTG